ncbi:methyl-accepting chemotaxis protein [Paraburkholderia adhaesiva]|uniref:methyl-accepting chemotaxis protein n=1 Tax=Paraburkholderia adhaesiva TaxID=2883244 RepID=UPI001F473EAB|nr:methyl-accepting chemotaxis protein [Paraburkholderia adhaesiva]
MLSKLSIRTSLTLMVTFIGVVLVIGAAVGLLSIRQSDLSLQAMYTIDEPAVADLEGSAGQLLRMRLALATYASLLDAGDQPGANAVLGRFDQYLKTSNDRLDHFRSIVTGDDEDQRLLKDMLDKRDSFLHQGIDPALAALKTGDRATFSELQAHKLPPLYAGYDQAMVAVEKRELANGARRFDDAHARFTVVCVAVGVGLVGALVLAWFARIALMRAIVHPVDTAVEQFHRIASGDLTTPIAVTSQNEMGKLLSGLQRMQEALITMVSTVRDGVASIDTGVSEIATGNTDLSQRTEQQAASLEETAASIEQLTSTVRQTAGNVQQASSLAQGASGLAGQGGDLAREVVGTMHNIVSDSQRIGEIVGVIEGIAFQTNILALNAAVEAARAGEEGRGFAVVAGEVRSLAQRSAAAAKEIKELIGTSTARVQTGAGLVERSGATMQEIVDAIARVSAIMGEIATAASEQSTGIDQVNIAVSQMDQVTQQNAALVEQSAAAAASLEDQARRLTTAISIFRTR